MSKSILAVLIEPLDNTKKFMSVAVRTEMGLYEVYQRTAADISNYEIHLTITHGRKISFDVARIIFPAITDTMQYDHTPVDNTAVLTTASLKELHGNLYDALQHITDAELRQAAITNLSEIRALTESKIVKNFDPAQ